jgi:hypothetical protein
LFNVFFTIIRCIGARFAGFAQKALADVKMNGFFGNAGSLDQLANLHVYLGWYDEGSDFKMLGKR